MLAVSRAMGDIFLQPYVTAEPDVHEIDLSTETRQVLIMGCDGVWDVLEDNEGKFIFFHTNHNSCGNCDG